MGALAPSHWILLLLVVVLLFGTGRISGVMGDFAKGLKSFKKNMADDSDVSMEAGERPAGSIAAPNVPHATVTPVQPVSQTQAQSQAQPTHVNPV